MDHFQKSMVKIYEQLLMIAYYTLTEKKILQQQDQSFKVKSKSSNAQILFLPFSCLATKFDNNKTRGLFFSSSH